jgi:uncharacterized OsmC-like protein
MTEDGFESSLESGNIKISGNEEKGFRPYQLLVSSLVGCSGLVLRKVCDKMRMPLESMEIEVREVIRNEKEANRLEKIHLHFKLKSTSLDERKMPRVMELTKKNCSMVQSVHASILIEESYEIIS